MDFVLKKELEKAGLIYLNLITETKPNLVRKIGYSNKIIAVRGCNDEVTRTALENRNVDLLLTSETCSEKDFIHSRNSGLNQVLCKIAKKNNTAIGFNFSDLINSDKRELLLGRMIQNVELCKKYKVKMVLGSFALNEIEIKNRSELMSFGKILGMRGNEINSALDFKKKEEKVKILK